MEEYNQLLQEMYNLKEEIELDRKNRGDGAIYDNLGAICVSLKALSNKLGYDLEEAYKDFQERG